jgi:DNA repair protein RadC
LSPVLGGRAAAQAQALLKTFGSIGGVSAASPEALRRVLGADGHLAMPFFVSRRILETGLRERVERTPVASDDQALLSWLVTRFAGMADECLVAIYLDGKGAFLSEESFRSGAEACVSVHPRTLFRQAVRLDCAGLLLAHNHPSGDARPSQLDIDATRRIAAHGRLLEVALVDHLIVAGNTVTSMKRAGLL